MMKGVMFQMKPLLPQPECLCLPMTTPKLFRLSHLAFVCQPLMLGLAVAGQCLPGRGINSTVLR